MVCRVAHASTGWKWCQAVQKGSVHLSKYKKQRVEYLLCIVLGARCSWLVTVLRRLVDYDSDGEREARLEKKAEEIETIARKTRIANVKIVVQWSWR